MTYTLSRQKDSSNHAAASPILTHPAESPPKAKAISLPLVSTPLQKVAKDLTGRPYLSFSQLQCYRRCPRRFAFRYLEPAPRDHLASSLLFGSCMHAAIELHFRQLLQGGASNATLLLDRFRSTWDRLIKAEQTTQVRFNKGESHDSQMELAERMVTAFLADSAADVTGSILAVEEEICIDIADDLPPLLTRVDLVVADEQRLSVVDFKTSRARWTEGQGQESAEQLLLYGLATQGIGQSCHLPIDLSFVVLTKQKNVQIQLVPVMFDHARTTALVKSIKQVWSSMTARHFYPIPSPQNCSGCEYRSQCPAIGR